VDCGVPPGEVAPGLGEALAAWVGVEGTEGVAAKLGMECGGRQGERLGDLRPYGCGDFRAEGIQVKGCVLVGVEVLQAPC